MSEPTIIGAKAVERHSIFSWDTATLPGFTTVRCSCEWTHTSSDSAVLLAFYDLHKKVTA